MPDLPILIVQNADDAEYFCARYAQKDFKRWIAYDALAQQILKNHGIEFTDESHYLSGQIPQLREIQASAHRMACEWYRNLPSGMFSGREMDSRPESLAVRAFNYFFQSSLCAYFFLKRVRAIEGACELWITKTGNAVQHTLLRDSARPLPDLLANLNTELWNFNLKWQPEPPSPKDSGTKISPRKEPPGGVSGALISASWRFKKIDVLFSGNPSLLGPVAEKLKALKQIRSAFLRPLRARREIPLLIKMNTVLYDTRVKPALELPNWDAVYVLLQRDSAFKFDGVDFLKIFREKVRDFYVNHASGFLQSYESLRACLKAVAPRYLVVDEDVTESHRALVMAARELKIKTLVVAHGLPGAPWGFMPLAADHIAVWGDYSTQAFQDWKLAADRILVTGCPKYDSLEPQENIQEGLKRKIAAARGWDPADPLVLIIPGKFRTDPFDRFDGSGSTSTETLKTAHIFLETAKKLPRVNFIFKFRADAQENTVFKELLGRKGQAPGNIDFTHEGLALDYLAASDLVFNNCSSACLESVLMKRPVAAMNYAYYPNVFPFYETGLGAVVRSGEETFEICRRLSEGKLPLAQWVESQEKLVVPFLFARDGGASERVARWICDGLASNRELELAAGKVSA